MLGHFFAVQHNEDYVLKVLQEVGLVSRKQVDAARKRLDGQNNVIDVLIKDGIVSESDVSRSLAAQAHMDWIDLSSMVIPPTIIKQIRAEDARRFKVIPVAFGETTAYQANPSNGYNPTFDLWSTAGATGGTNQTQWIKNW